MEKIKRENGLFVYLHSLAYLFIAYIIIFVVSHLGVSVIALVFRIPTEIYLDRILYLVEEDHWSNLNVISVFFSRWIMNLILLIFFYIIYKKTIFFSGYLKTLIMWGLMISFIFLTGEMVFGNIFGLGVSYSLNWMLLEPSERLVIVMVFLSIFFYYSYKFGKVFVHTSNIYVHKLTKYNIKPYFLYHILYPYLTFVIVFTLLILPDFPIMLMLSVYSGIILIIIGLFQMGKVKRVINEDQDIKPITINRNLIIITFIVVVVFVLIFKNGLIIS